MAIVRKDGHLIASLALPITVAVVVDYICCRCRSWPVSEQGDVSNNPPDARRKFGHTQVCPSKQRDVTIVMYSEFQVVGLVSYFLVAELVSVHP